MRYEAALLLSQQNSIHPPHPPSKQDDRQFSARRKKNHIRKISVFFSRHLIEENLQQRYQADLSTRVNGSQLSMSRRPVLLTHVTITMTPFSNFGKTIAPPSSKKQVAAASGSGGEKCDPKNVAQIFPRTRR
jgi:hypothetical protein